MEDQNKTIQDMFQILIKKMDNKSEETNRTVKKINEELNNLENKLKETKQESMEEVSNRMEVRFIEKDRRIENNRQETIQLPEKIIGSRLEESQNKIEEKLQTLRSLFKDEFQVTVQRIEVLKRI